MIAEDLMKPVKGYFKIEQVNKSGVVESTYEDYNTVMIRVPALIAEGISGCIQNKLPSIHIHAFALGTDGSFEDDLGNVIPKTVSNTRTRMFSEDNFWDSQNISSPAVGIDETRKRVYQRTFEAAPIIDFGGNPANLAEQFGGNEGSTMPHQNFQPLNYREIKPSPTPYDGTYTKLERSQRNTEIIYSIEVGQFVANHQNNTVLEYSEAALYLRLGANMATAPEDPNTGNPLGQLFSMKTFPPVKKSRDCSIRITWKLYF